MDVARMQSTAEALVAPGKGILAADESTPTMARRLAAIGLDSTVDRRRVYRSMLFSTAGLSEHVSGVILFDETLRQVAVDGTPIVELIRAHGLVPGIKVDGGTRPMPAFSGEVVTEGLDGLRERLAEYAEMGAAFAKWRAVIRIGDGLPTDACVAANAHVLARYAALAQEAGLMPIVEPEVLMDGDHTIQRCAEVTEAVLRAVYAELGRYRVVLEATLLKPNMVLPGADCPDQVDDETIAQASLEVFRRTVPAAVPGLVHLSGGQSPEQATARLCALNRAGPQPWQLSYSYGRALQGPVLKAWGGYHANEALAQAELLRRVTLNGAARGGTYTAAMEEPVLVADT